MDRNAAARAVGMTRQTLRDWIRRYNDEGIDGIRNKPKGRPKSALTREQEQQIDALITQPPESPLVRWRCVDVQSEIKKRFGVVLHERSVGKLLRKLGFRRISVRPLHPETDAAAQEAFKKTSPRKLQKSCPITPKTNALSSGSKTKQGSAKKTR